MRIKKGLPSGVGPADRAGRIRNEELIEMEVLYDRVAGLDIGKASVTVCVRTPGGRRGSRHSVTRTFKTTTGSLAVMRTGCSSPG